jgi:CRISPR-associated protein Csd1
MILQSLHTLYSRLKDDPAYSIPSLGYSLQKITFVVVLKPDGILFGIQDARIGERKSPRQIRVLGYTKSSGSALNPCFLWDNTAYMLGFKSEGENPERSKASFEVFRNRHLNAEQEINSPKFSAVCRFLESWQPAKALEHAVLSEVSTGFGLFQILGETSFIHEDAAIDRWWKNNLAADHEPGPKGQCLIIGRSAAIARLQPMIKGISGGKAQAALVGFNDSAYESYGKEQSYNAPISEAAAFEYAMALNSLLDGPMKSKHRTTLADMTIAFWTDKPSLVEDIFAQFASNGAQINNLDSVQSESLRQKIALFLDALRQGTEKYPDIEQDAGKTNFYILGLSPNAARVSVRLFLRTTIRGLLDNLRKHYHDMTIERQFGADAKLPDPEFPPTWLLLRQTARNSDGIPPILAGPLMRAILSGSRYPDGLFSALMRRIHADRDINYLRACIIKGYLNRNQGREITMSLDTERSDPAYRLGRLFAALEKTQGDALGNLNASIRDRFYSSVSSTPRSVFPRLLRTYQHHLGKLEGGRKVNRERLVQEIIGPLVNFPAHLNLADQGLFAIGYYHQMQRFYQKKEDVDHIEINNHEKETQHESL